MRQLKDGMADFLLGLASQYMEHPPAGQPASWNKARSCKMIEDNAQPDLESRPAL
jgi:hypothetical protein